MFEIQIPSTRDYDAKNARHLLAQMKDLRSFDEIADWDKKASSEVEGMRISLQKIENNLRGIIDSINQDEQEHQSKSLISRIFSGRKEKNRLISEQNRLIKDKSDIEKLIEQFEYLIDFTPDSVDDLKELVKECRQHKKELQTEKKAINAQMATIRVEARQKSTQTITGSYGKWERRRIRLNKESSLQPHESEKASIERQIIKIDQILIWLERFN
jgi:hypothetical protein